MLFDPGTSDVDRSGGAGRAARIGRTATALIRSALHGRAVAAGHEAAAEQVGVRASTSRISTPALPSAEWAISRSAMFTPSSVASV